MRKLTFKGFLASYVRELSFAGTVDIAVLAGEVSSGNMRLRAPLLLYAAAHGKTARLRTQLAAKGCGEELMNMLARLENTDLEEALKAGELPEEYCKVWNSYCVRRDGPAHEDTLKAAMRRKIIQMQNTKRCSNYRLYTDLKLNPGNINAWLKHGDSAKVSYRTAERMITYLTEY